MSSTTDRIPLAQAQAIAAKVLAKLRPHFAQMEIAGSVRRWSAEGHLLPLEDPTEAPS